MNRRTKYFALPCAASLVAFWGPVRLLVGTSLEHNYYSHEPRRS